MYAWNPLAVALGRFITERRSELRLKQTVLGERMGVSRSFCSFLESAMMRKLASGCAEQTSFGSALGAALNLTDEPLRRFTLCYRVVRKVEDLRRHKEWEAHTVRFVREFLLKEPELSTILWPNVLLMKQAGPKRLTERRRLVIEAYLVERMRDYIFVRFPPIPSGMSIPEVEEMLEELQTAA